MAKIYNYVCTSSVDGDSPSTYACTLALTDDALIGSSGTWVAGGPSPARIFIAQRGKWAKLSSRITLDSASGEHDEQVVMLNADADSGEMIGNGLVSANTVKWKRT